MLDEALVAAARGLRDERPELLRQAGPRVGPALEGLLARAGAGEDVGDAIVDLLAGNTETRDELQRRLSLTDVRGIGGDLPGLPDPSDAIWYVCLAGEYRYPVFELGEPVPQCPNGHGALRRM